MQHGEQAIGPHHQMRIYQDPAARVTLSVRLSEVLSPEDANLTTGGVSIQIGLHVPGLFEKCPAESPRGSDYPNLVFRDSS
jgi:hypothetical protein